MPVATQTENVLAAQWDTAYVDSLPSSSFAYVSGDTRKLPYKDKDGKVDLPHVRNALARLNQTQGIPDDEKAKIRTKLQNALKSVKASDDTILRSVSSAIQADATTGELPDRVHLLREGEFHTQKYGKVPVKADDIRNMVVNFNQGVGMPNDGPTTGIPVDFSHKAGEKAGAWIHALEATEGDDGALDLWGTKVEWTQAGREEVGGGNFKYISADFYPAAFGEWVDPESGVVATSVMVGAGFTNRPMFTGNRAVMASEVEAEAEREAEATGVKTVVYVNASETIKETRMNLDQLRIKAAEDLSGAEYKFVIENQKELSADERTKFGLAASTEEPKKPETKVVTASEVTGTEGVVAIQASDLKALQDSIANLKADQETQATKTAEMEREKMKAIVVQAAERGALKPDRIDSYTDRLVAAQGKDREELITDLEALASNPLLAGSFGSNKTEGSAAMDVEAEITKKVRELMASDRALNAFDARKQVLAADPELEAKAATALKAASAGFSLDQAWGTDGKGLQGVNPEIAK